MTAQSRKTLALPKGSERLMVALDTADLASARKLLKGLEGVVTFYKIGFELFTACGWEAVRLVREFGGRVFLDLKLHDIPNTVAKTAAVIVDHEVDMFNVHALGGFDMMKKTREQVDACVKAGKSRPVILGVTILTSHNEEDLATELGISKNLKDEVFHLARLVKAAGLDGVVSSSHEVELLRRQFPKDFLIVTPGIRPLQSASDDQKRVFTPQEAVAAGSNYLVVGRPITGSERPREAALAILDQIKG